MASLSTSKKDGGKRVLFLLPSGERRAIRLGDMPDPETFAEKLESLLACRRCHQAEGPAIVEWLAGLPDRFYDRLAGFGLVAPRAPIEPPKAGTTLAAFVDGYIAKRTDIKASTWSVMDQTRKNLKAFFKDKLMTEVTKADTQDFRRWLSSHKLLGENTIRRRIGVCRQFYNDAIDRELLTKNPFKDKKMPVAVRGNPERSYFVTREETAAVLEKCPDAEWRALVALARWGGLRTPSEPLALNWGDVCWDRGRFTVHATKTEHHENAGIRVVPLFPELEPYLLALWNNQGPAEPVIMRYRETRVNLRTQLLKIIGRAGLKPWPKLWQNMRASRETELCKQYPMHVACAWIGHTKAVAAEYYLQVTEADFERAAGCTQKCTQSASAKPGFHRSASNPTFASSPVGTHLSNVLTDSNRQIPEMTGKGGICGNTPGRTRTANPLVRSQMLCPIELRARARGPPPGSADDGPRSESHVWQQSHEPGPLDGLADGPLLGGIGPGALARHHLAAGGQELAEQLDFLIVDNRALPVLTAAFGESSPGPVAPVPAALFTRLHSLCSPSAESAASLCRIRPRPSPRTLR